MTQRETRLAELKKRIAALDDERTAIAAEIAALERVQMLATPFPSIVSLERVGHVVDRHSETDQKISLFREMFRGRTDVFPIRWANAKSAKSGYAPNIREAIELYVEDCRDAGDPIPTEAGKEFVDVEAA